MKNQTGLTGNKRSNTIPSSSAFDKHTNEHFQAGASVAKAMKYCLLLLTLWAIPCFGLDLVDIKFKEFGTGYFTIETTDASDEGQSLSTAYIYFARQINDMKLRRFLVSADENGETLFSSEHFGEDKFHECLSHDYGGTCIEKQENVAFIQLGIAPRLASQLKMHAMYQSDNGEKRVMYKITQ